MTRSKLGQPVFKVVGPLNADTVRAEMTGDELIRNAHRFLQIQLYDTVISAR
jgi:hypothetical protein